MLGCLGSGDDDRAAPATDAEPLAQFKGPRGDIESVVLAYAEAVESSDPAALCRELVRAKHAVSREQPNSCVEDPDNDARAPAEVSDDLKVLEVIFVPRRPQSRRIPREVPRWLAEDELATLPDAFALARSGASERASLTAFGLSRVQGEWGIDTRMSARQVEAPSSGRARRTFFRQHDVLGALGIARRVPGGRCEGSEGQIHVDGTITYVRAPDARAALLRSELIGKRVGRVLERGGELELLSVDYAERSRQFQLRGPAGGSLVVPVTGTGPIYYVNNYGGCTDDRLVKRFLPL